jgi:hypothetical protein
VLHAPARAVRPIHVWAPTYSPLDQSYRVDPSNATYLRTSGRFADCIKSYDRAIARDSDGVG